MNPLARKEGLIQEELHDELMVLDRESHQVHCLNATAAAIWRGSDGETSVPQLATALGVEQDVVWYTLKELAKCGLVNAEIPQRAQGLTRRQVVKLMAAAALAPLITSAAAPVPAMAGSCTEPPGFCGFGQPPCCPGSVCNESTCI